MIIGLWIIVGLAYPLYRVFLPVYLADRGAKVGAPSPYITYRNYAINQAASLPAPVLATAISEIPRVGRKGALAASCIVASKFFDLDLLR